MRLVAQAPMSFDLRAGSEARRRAYRSVRVGMATIGALFAIPLGLNLSSALKPGGLSTPLEWLQFLTLVPGLALMIAMLLFASYKLGAGATGLKVDSQGLLFVWSSGRTERVAWDQTTHGFKLLDYTVTPAIPSLTGVSWELRRRNRPATYLSEEAFKAILEGARRRGMKISSVVPSSTDFRQNFWGWARCRIITFGPHA
jgi:hypothetical protein